MSDFVKCAWYLFFAFLFFGLWVIPILVAFAVIIWLILRYKPEWLDKC